MDGETVARGCPIALGGAQRAVILRRQAGRRVIPLEHAAVDVERLLRLAVLDQPAGRGKLGRVNRADTQRLLDIRDTGIVRACGLQLGQGAARRRLVAMIGSRLRLDG